MTNPKICIILNPGSGREKDEGTDTQIRDLFAARGATVALHRLSKERGIAVQVNEALDSGCSTIIAAGGDGTVCGVAGALAGRDVTMGVLPLGTFNYFARSLGLSGDLEEAVEVILGGRCIAARTGTINDRLFLNNTSIGRYPEILQTREGIYRRWGRSRIAAYWSVLVTFLTLRRPLKLHIDADGTRHTLRTPLVFVLNNAFQLRELGLRGVDELKAGKLLMFVSPDTGRWGLIRQSLAVAMGVAQETRDFYLLTAERFLITSHRKRHLVALDGERARLSAPLKIEAHPGALRVIVPDRYEGEVR